MDKNNQNWSMMSEAILWQLPGFVIVKDTSSKYLGCNKNFTLLVGYSDLDSIVGIMDEDLKCEASNYAELFRQQDKEAMFNTPQNILDIHRFADNKIWICVSKKIPFHDVAGEVVGCINQMSEVNIPLLTQLGIAIIKSNSSYAVKSNSLSLSNMGYDRYQLSKKESECLFYLLRGYSAKCIAKFLVLSHRTVESYIDSIKNKFHCTKKSELIELAISEGFLTIIPTSILPKSLSLELPKL